MDLSQQLMALPTTPGVYLFKDAAGKILYVGKAKRLRSRVQSYFRENAALEVPKQEMVELIDHFETISTTTEQEALVLEANLIAQHQPPYNVVLRDDKFYLFIKITTQENEPRVFLTRRLKKDGARYFGPYSSARTVRHTLRLLQRLFPHKGEKERPRDIIFPHPLFSTAEKNPDNIQHIIRFLRGDRDEVITTLTAGMKKASAEKQFEQARIFRDQLEAVAALDKDQNVYLASGDTLDAVSLAQGTTRSAVNIFSFRKGKLLNKNTFLLRHRLSALPADILRQFILQYYNVAQDVPGRIVVPLELPDANVLASWINDSAPPEFTVPQRGRWREILEMGQVNAKQVLWEENIEFLTGERLQKAVAELASAIGLTQKLSRIETYDISNIQGTLATGSMVVFIDGKADPKQYRRFRIKLGDTPNDFAMLQEVLGRRFSARNQDWPKPDLLMIDGGKGQLSSAVAVLHELHIDVPVISLAKQEEEIFMPGNPTSIRLPPDSEALYLIQRMRDEAHRFTITYHRHLRSQQQKRSILDEIPGIGPKTKKKLLRHFGSLKGIRAASEEELEKVVGTAAKAIKDFI